LTSQTEIAKHGLTKANVYENQRNKTRPRKEISIRVIQLRETPQRNTPKKISKKLDA